MFVCFRFDFKICTFFLFISVVDLPKKILFLHFYKVFEQAGRSGFFCTVIVPRKIGVLFMGWTLLEGF